MNKRQKLRPEKIYTPTDLKAAQKVFREFCGDNMVMMEAFAAADLCAKIANAIAMERESCATAALGERCVRGTPWDIACTSIADKIRARGSLTKGSDANG